MKQFDICRNPGQSRDAFPYFVIIQSNEFATTSRRLVVPLTRHISGYPSIAPTFVVEEAKVIADALLLFAIPCDRLGSVIGSLADDESAETIINAVDRVISRIYA
jgi:hypothetical protein